MAEKMILPEWFGEARRGPCPAGGAGRRMGFMDRSLGSVASFMKEVMNSEEYASRRGLLQAIDARARIGGAVPLAVAAALSSKTAFLVFVFAAVIALTKASRVDLLALGSRVLPAFVFTTVLAIPVFFNFITPGERLVGIALYGREVSITAEGLSTGSFFMARVAVMASIISLLFLTTRQADFYRALGRLPVPGVFVTALFMTFRYIFILLKTVEDSALARKSRVIGAPGLKGSRRWFASRSALVLRKSLSIAEEVGLAMAARGFTGTIVTPGAGALSGRDFLWIGFSVFVLFLSMGL